MGGGHASISAVHVILNNIASSFKVRQLINSLFEFRLFENHSSILLTALNRPTISSLILKHWVPSWIENGIKWVNRKIGVHVGRPKCTTRCRWQLPCLSDLRTNPCFTAIILRVSVVPVNSGAVFIVLLCQPCSDDKYLWREECPLY